MNLPNKLTMMRVVLVPVFMIFAAVSHYGTADFHAAYMLIAGVIFAIASITDFLDGYLARKNHLVTDFGKFMDPLADKCLTTAAFIYMVTDHVCSPIVLAVILFREFAVAGVRMLAADADHHLLLLCRCAGRAYGCWLCQLCHRCALLVLRRGDPALRRHLPVAEPQAVHAGEVTAAAQ